MLLAARAREKAWVENRPLSIGELNGLRKKMRQNSKVLAEHGTYARYKQGDRCDLCRAANAEYMRGWIAERRKLNAQAFKFVCPKCGAPVGERCMLIDSDRRQKNGEPYRTDMTHAARVDLIDEPASEG